jgi:hypothetical protein
MSNSLPPELQHPVGVRDLRRIFGTVSGQTIANYRRLGMPRLGHGMYDAIACLRWRIAYMDARDRIAWVRWRTAELQARMGTGGKKEPASEESA